MIQLQLRMTTIDRASPKRLVKTGGRGPPWEIFLTSSSITTAQTWLLFFMLCAPVWGLWGPTPPTLRRVAADDLLEKRPLPTLCCRTKFGRSRSNRMGVGRRGSDKNLWTMERGRVSPLETRPAPQVLSPQIWWFWVKRLVRAITMILWKSLTLRVSSFGVSGTDANRLMTFR